MEHDLEARLMGKTLIINRSQDPNFGDFLKLNDLNEPLELKRNQVKDLGPTIEECEVTNAPIEEIVKTRNDNDEITNRIEDYPNFTVLEDMDAYRDKEMGDVIVGKEFCKDIKVNAKRFEGMIAIYNGNDEVTYQMVRSHPRFKYLTNEQCNKILPLLKVSAQDKLQGISHPYQKLKRLYKGVLNLGTEYIKDDKVKEWLTRGHKCFPKDNPKLLFSIFIESVFPESRYGVSNLMDTAY
ncbi:hypothetical protein Tco_1489098 [Tanacetum coccineum]